MQYLGENSESTTRVNVLKKVKVNGSWKLCPAVVERNGKLKDRVHINGRAEMHSEGVYYIEWRESNRRRRQAIPNRNEVLERARLKALELDAGKASIKFTSLQRVPHLTLPPPSANMTTVSATDGDAARIGGFTGSFLQGLESCLHNFIGAAVRSHLAALGMPSETPMETCLALNSKSLDYQVQDLEERQRAQAPDDTGTNQRAGGKILIAEAIESYLKDVEPPQREQKTYDEYRLVLYKFRDTCEKKHLNDINRDDCLSFMRHLYSIRNEARTVFNRMGIVQQLLKLHGITGLLQGRDKPKFVANIREMYQPESLEALFRACTPDERVLYLFFLLTGERDKEVRYTTWPDIDFVRKCVRVTEKKILRFKPKDKEEREIPVPSLLLTALKEYKAHQPCPNPHNLVFPTSQGKPDKKFENKLKRIARRAGLNCGHCESKHGNKCAEGPHCSKWYLHKFRHTFATTNLENGVSIRTVQGWLGHSDLASTMIYLKFVRRKDIHKLLDSSQMADLAAQSLGLPNSSVHAEKGV